MAFNEVSIASLSPRSAKTENWMAIDSHRLLRPRMMASRSLGISPKRCALSNVVSVIATRLIVIRLVADREVFMSLAREFDQVDPP